jgi:heat shock protein HslJ
LENRLEGVTWYLVVFHTASGRSVGVVPGTEITVYFDTNGKITGHTSCNHFTATYSATVNGLTFRDPITTEKYCGSPASIMSQEATFLAVLPQASSYRVEGDLLTIMESRGNPILTFIRIKPAHF